MGIRPETMFTLQSLAGGAIISIPNPEQSSGKNLIATLVNSGRNAEGVTTAQKIGRDQEKTEMKWTYLEKDEWEGLLRFWNDNFYFLFTYYSRVSGTKISRVFYIGDRSDQPINVDESGIPIAYRDCVANVIDTGEGA
jgi:hypothetical protein